MSTGEPDQIQSIKEHQYRVDDTVRGLRANIKRIEVLLYQLGLSRFRSSLWVQLNHRILPVRLTIEECEGGEGGEEIPRFYLVADEETIQLTKSDNRTLVDGSQYLEDMIQEMVKTTAGYHKTVDDTATEVFGLLHRLESEASSRSNNEK